MDWNKTNAYRLSYLLESKSSVIQNQMVNGINLFISGWVFWMTWPMVIMNSTAHFFIVAENGKYSASVCTMSSWISLMLYLSFADTLWLLGPLFCPFLDLSHTSQICISLTCAEIKIEIWISLSSFIRGGSVVVATKMFSYASSLLVRLRIFWTSLVWVSITFLV